MTPVPLTDQQKTHLRDKRSAYLKSSKQDNNTYLPSQPIWFIDDSSDEWKPGYIESKDITPDSYWITNDKKSRRFRRNKHDIKPRYITITHQRPKPQVPVRYPAHLSDDDATSAIPEVQEPVSSSQIHRLLWENHPLPVTTRTQQHQRTILMLERSEHQQM